MLPEHVRCVLGLEENYDESQLDLVLNGLARPCLSMIHSQDGLDLLRRAALGNLELMDQLEVIPRTGGHATWRTAEFIISGSIVLKVVCIPERIPDDVPPTNVEQLLIKAWILNKDILEQKPDTEHILAPGKTLLFWSSTEHSLERKTSIQQTAECLLGFWEKGAQISYAETWGSHTEFQLSEIEREIVRNRKTAELFRIAASESNIRWKFLGFYRIIEFGYLSNVLSGINQEFLKDPATVVEDAAEALKNEYNQFRKLSQENKLDQLFEDLLTVFEQLVGSYNTFACALERRLGSDARLKKHLGRAAKGVLLVYLIRCAIVHAGEGALLFESYRDAEAALSRLISPLELVVLSYLGIAGS